MPFGFLLNVFRLATSPWSFSAEGGRGIRSGIFLVGLVGLIGWGGDVRADEVEAAPIFVEQPAAATTLATGNAVTLSALVTGNPPPTLQWSGGASGVVTSPIEGAVAGEYTTPVLTKSASYWVQASNAVGQANSATAVVTITAPAAIATQPASKTFVTGARVGLSVVATGSPAPVYQWYEGSRGDSTTLVAGATAATLNTIPLTAAATYWVRVSNSTGSADSLAATVTPVAKPDYSAASRDITAPNTGEWSAAGVTLGGASLVNLGLQGVGRVPASAIDPATGESLGSISDFQVTGFTKNPDGSFRGTMETLPDRGYNAGTLFSNYAARINSYQFSFSPYTGSAATEAQDQVVMNFTGSSRFTYDHDGDPETAAVFTTGLLATETASLFGTTVPVVAGETVQSDGAVVKRLTVDAEGLVLDTRAGKAGSGWVSDEYGASLYHFNAAKQIDGQLLLPAALIPHAPVGVANFLADPPVNGRRINQGLEGLAQSPDGSKLFGLLQSATLQDSGSGNVGRSTTRLVVFDVASSDLAGGPAQQYVVQLPKVDSDAVAGVDRTAAQSSIVALNNHQLLILSRDGNGRGSSGTPVFKSILLADLALATDIDGRYDEEGQAVAPAGKLVSSVVAVDWKEALNMIGGLGSARAELAKFGFNFEVAPGNANTVCEKWEALSLVSAQDPSNPDDFFLFVGNDNDFLTRDGRYLDSAGQLQSYDAGLENDTVVLVYRVRVAAAELAVYAGSPATGPALVDGAVEGFGFGEVDLGRRGTQRFSLSNGGVSRLTGLEASLSGADADCFEVTSAPPGSLEPGQTGSVTVAFKAARVGMKSAVLHLRSQGAEGAVSFEVALTGLGTRAPLLVAAGDVSQTEAVLWGRSDQLGELLFEYAEDASFAVGVGRATAEVVDTLQPVKVSLSGLASGKTYHYRVSGQGESALGQFQTAAAAGVLGGLRFGVSGDQRGELAPYPSIQNAAGRNLNFFLQLGDTIYGDVGTPDLPVGQARSLSEFRTRHNEVYGRRYGMNSYAALRSATAVLATIDDHEVTNDFSGAEPRLSDGRFSGDSGELISDTETFANGMQAFREYHPGRDLQYGATGDVATAGRAKLYRYHSYGRDAAVFMLDARSFRSAPLTPVANINDPAEVGAFLVGSFAPGRTLLGAAQLAEFKMDLMAAQAAGTVWKFVMCPEPMQNFGPLGAEDRYEGYAYERREILQFIETQKISNVVFVTADFHGTAVNRLSYQMGPGQAQIQTNCLEIITGSVAYDKPFGPTIVDLAMGVGLVPAGTDLYYQSLPAGGKESLVAGIINPGLEALGYNRLSLTANPLPQAQLREGFYMATNSYGWTEFSIDAATQQLKTTTWGIAPYNQAQLEADPAGVTGRLPEIVSEFQMSPAPSLKAAAAGGLAVAADGSPLRLLEATGVAPAGGTFSGAGVMGDAFDPALAAVGMNVVTYKVADGAGGTQSVEFAVDVLPAAVLAATPSNNLSISLQGSVVLTDTGAAAGSGGAEIPAYDPVSRRAFAASPVGVQVADLSNPRAPQRLAPIDPVAAGLSSRDISHVVVRQGVLAVSIIAVDKTQPGSVAFFQASDGVFLGSVLVGANPDQLIFTADSKTILVANEGEMALAPGEDPEGSISLIDVSGGFASASVRTVDFRAFNGQEEALRAAGVRIFPGKSAAQDLEPEYIAISGDGATAMITLQEANAVAVLDVASAVITGVYPLGYKNMAPLQADYSDRDGPLNAKALELKTGLPVLGMFMPDGIASYQSSGKSYYVIANEGDDRNDFLEPDETTTVNAANYDLDNSVFPDEGTAGGSGSAGALGTGLKGNDQLGRLTVCNVPGLRGDLDGDGDIDRILAYGGRSFSILDASGRRVFDSGDVIDRILMEQYPAMYDDARSDNKSAEPEGVAITVLGGKTYAFIGLERAHGVMVFDVTDPGAVSFTTLCTRSGDLNPEGMLNIAAADSPTGQPLLLVANEVSNTLSVYEVTPDFTLQVLHFYGESGLLGLTTAPIMGALIDKFDDQYSNTLVVAEGDTTIPGPWLVGGADPSLNTVPGIGVTALGRPDIAILNAFGTAASALGNHEFDLGSATFQGALVSSGTWVGAQFPFLTANLDFSADSSLKSRADSTLGGTAGAIAGKEVSSMKAQIAPYAVKTLNGQKIGLIGATTYDLLVKTSPNGTIPKDDGNPATSDLEEVAAYIQGAVQSLEAMGVNKIVLLDQLDTIERNAAIAPLLRGIDIMVAGGGHERMGDATDAAVGFNGHSADFIAQAYPLEARGADGKPVLIVTTDTEFSYLGRLVVEFDRLGEVLASRLSPEINGAYAATERTLQAAYSTGDSAAQIVARSTMGSKVKAITDAIQAVVLSKDAQIYGYTAVYLEGDRVFGRAEEVNLGNITADANVAKAKAALGLGSGTAVFSLKNGGGIRASVGSIDEESFAKIAPLANPLTGKPAGAITQLDVENALRFDNKLMVFTTTPQGLLNILNYAAGLSAGNGGFPQVGNIRYATDPSKPVGQRVRSVVLTDENGEIVNRVVGNGLVMSGAQAVIPVVALSFTANGGDGYPTKANGSNFRFLLADGTLSAAVALELDFTAAANVPANVLGEQRAFADYLAARFVSPAAAFGGADTAASSDRRIQNLSVRLDDTMAGPAFATLFEEWIRAKFTAEQVADPSISGMDANPDGDGRSNAFEFALGSLPLSFDFAPPIRQSLSGSGETRQAVLSVTRDGFDYGLSLEVSGSAGEGFLGAACRAPSATEWEYEDGAVSVAAARYARLRLQLEGEASARYSEVYATRALAAAQGTRFGSAPWVEPRLAAGVVGEVGDKTLVSPSITWPADLLVGGSCYVVLTTGPNAGVTADLMGVAGKSLGLGEDLRAIALSGDGFEIRRHHTLGSLFGRSQAGALQSGANAAVADNVQLLQPDGATETYFGYAEGGPVEWLDNNFASSDQRVILPEQSFVIRRKQAETLTLFQQGVVAAGRHGVAGSGVPLVVPVETGANLVTAPADRRVSLAQLSLYTGDPVTGLASGLNASTADRVVVPQASGAFKTYYYYKNGASEGWVDAAGRPAGSVLLEAGGSFYIVRKAPRPAFPWSLP